MTTAVNTELANGVCAPAYVVIEMGTDLPSGTAPSLFQQNVRATEGNASGQTHDGAPWTIKGVFWLLIDIVYNILNDILDNKIYSKARKEDGSMSSVRPAEGNKDANAKVFLLVSNLTNLTAGALRSCHQEELAQWLEQRTGTEGDHLLPDPNGESRSMKVKLQIVITLIKCVAIVCIYCLEKLQLWPSSSLANERHSQGHRAM